MKKHWIQCPATGELIPAEAYYAAKAEADAPFVMGDIQPYQSMATGEMIGGRRQHREHLKAHGLIEIGNEVPRPRTQAASSDRKQQIARAVYEKLSY